MAFINERAVSRTRLIEVPFLVNNTPLEENEELLLEIGHKKKEAPETSKKRSWRDVLQENAKKLQKIQQQQKKADAKAAKSSEAGIPQD